MTASVPEIVVIGAGIGGLTTAATLTRHGLPVTVLEAQAIPGGCASTFYYQGYRFDAGATLAGGFYPGGPMDLVGRAAGVLRWPAFPADPVMRVTSSLGWSINLSGGHERWEQRRSAFGNETDAFWIWQERTADAMWELALKLPAWPPRSISQLFSLSRNGRDWLRMGGDIRQIPSLLIDGFRPIAAHLNTTNMYFSEFIDAQLMISAQATSQKVNALYGAAALDLPRRGVAHIEGGIGGIAEALVKSIRQHGGQVFYHQEVRKLVFEKNRPAAVVTRRGQTYPARIVISNLPPWDTVRLISGGEFPTKLEIYPKDGWGAFILYLGVDGALIPPDFPLHNQVIIGQPMGEGNTIFLSASPSWENTRSPKGKRAITISTHTSLEPWWELFENDRDAYQQRMQIYTGKVLAAAETILPGIRGAHDLILPGTPVTFQRFTRRPRGWVGGFPQTGLFRSAAPYLGRDVWMVGDSIFPGQSTAATSIGGLRIAIEILDRLKIERKFSFEHGIADDCWDKQPKQLNPGQLKPGHMISTVPYTGMDDIGN
jgi:C-3',4' desaturase CrtD